VEGKTAAIIGVISAGVGIIKGKIAADTPPGKPAEGNVDGVLPDPYDGVLMKPVGGVLL
jgi:hypothetical protein